MKFSLPNNGSNGIGLYHKFGYKRYWVVLAVPMVICLFSTTSAYVLPGLHVLELMTQKLKKVDGLLVAQQLVIYDDSLPDGVIEISETLRYQFPETFRSDIEAENMERIHIVRNGESLTVIDGEIGDAVESRFDRYKDILLYRSRKLLQATLASCGVDVFVSSLGRFQDKIAFIIGAQYPDESMSQMWVDQETFLPIRWLIQAEERVSLFDFLDVRYLDWRQVEQTWYPMRIEFYYRDFLVRELKVESIETTGSFVQELFDIEQIRSVYQPASGSSGDQNGSKELREVQKTIEDFKKIYK